MIVISEIICVDPSTGLPQVILVTNAEHYTYGDKTYLPILEASGGYQQTLFSKNTTSGIVTVDITDLTLDNTDGILDNYKNFGFSGHPVSIHLLAGFDDFPNPNNLYFKGITASVSERDRKSVV